MADSTHALVTTTTWNSWSQAERDAYDGHYETMTAWDTAQARDLTTTSDTATLVCYDDWASGYPGEYLILSDADWVTDTDSRIIITVAEGHRHNGILGDHAGFWIDMDGNSDCFRLFIDYVEFHWLDIEATYSDRARDVLDTTSTAIIFINNCIIRNTSNSTTAAYNTAFLIPQGGTLINCIGCSTNASAFYSWSASPTGELYNSIAVDSETGFSGYLNDNEDHHIDIRNCITYGCTNDTNGYSKGATCATDSATGDETFFTVTSLTSTDFIDSTNGDYHIPTSSDLYEAGTAYTGVFTTDIDGDTWNTSWSIGIDNGTTTGPSAVNDSYSVTVGQALTATAGGSPAGLLDNDTYSCS